MVIRTKISKSNTIIKESENNYGLYPISMLNYGNIVSRVILQFDLDRIRNFTSGYFGNKKITHKLKMTNCGNVDWRKLGETVPSKDINSEKQRACSFTVLAVEIPDTKDYSWDEGIGFDDTSDFWLIGRNSSSNKGSNWFNSKSGSEWLKSLNNGLDKGIYTSEYISIEYSKYLNAKLSDTEYEGIILDAQDFDHGNEDLEIDISKYIERSKYNNGIMLMFAPNYEYISSTLTQYVGFFNEKTNTFFKPCVESRIDDAIQDNRFDFSLKSNNRLYLYFTDGEKYIDLDREPTCDINGTTYPVKKQFTGCYYVTVNKDQQIGMSEEEIITDSWVVTYDGETEEVEQEFVTHAPKIKFSSKIGTTSTLEPALSGIRDDETLNKGDIRKVNIKFRKPYSTDFSFLNNTFYRIYVKEIDRETTVIDWDYIENVGDNNYFLIDTSSLESGKYFVDIKVKNGLETKIFKEKLLFNIPNDITRITH